MKIEKLTPHCYRIRKTINHKTHSITFDHKPTEREILQKLSEIVNVVDNVPNITFEAAAIQYCEMKKNVISPSTYREYTQTIKRLSDDFLLIPIARITQNDIQIEVNRLSGTLAPKTVRNYHGFISSVLGAFKPSMKIYTTLPQKVKNEPYIPTDEDVKRLLAYAKDSKYYIALCLACYGLRRSELIAVTPEDIQDDIVTINKAIVMDSDKNWVTKSTKTVESTRQVPISHDLSEMIKKQGYVYQGHPNDITDYIDKALKELDIPHFSLHKLRHYFVTKLSSENIDVETILKLGGYSSDYVMKSVYRHAVNDKMKNATDIISLTIH